MEEINNALKFKVTIQARDFGIYNLFLKILKEQSTKLRINFKNIEEIGFDELGNVIFSKGEINATIDNMQIL